MRRVLLLVLVALGLSLFAGYGTFLIQKQADTRALNAMSPVTAYRATESIPVRTTLRIALAQHLIERTEFPKNLIGEDSLQGINSSNFGLVTLIPISKGQLIYRSFIGTPKVAATTLAVPDNYSAVSLNLTSEARVGGYLIPGDYVDVMGTFKNSANLPETHRVLSQIRVLAIGKNAINGFTINDTGGLLQNLVTIAVKPSDIATLLTTASKGSISLVLLAPTAQGSSPGVESKVGTP